MKIFSGTSNQKLALKLTKELKVKLGKINISRFANNECRVSIKEKDVNTTAVILQSLSNPPDTHIIEFCLIADAVKRLGAKKLIAIIPYLGYSKQDKIFKGGEPLSVKVVAQIIQTSSFSKIITIDLHNQAIVGFFEKPVIQLSANKMFLNYFSKLKDSNTIVIAPDAGAIKNSTDFANKLNLEVAYIDKIRDLSTGKVKIRGLSRDITNKKIIMIDDMISTGSTLIASAKYLKKKGAKSIIAGITHHLYVEGTQEKIERSKIDKLIVTDTIKKPKGVKYKKLKIISVAKLTAEALKTV